VTCFFDASHGPATQDITWTPQWGAPRPIRCCAACAQRWTEYLQGRGGYPQAGYQQGYPQPGYPQPGYAQPGYPPPMYGDYDDRPQRRHGYGLGAVAAAGAAGLVGGMVVNELFDDDDEHVEIVDHVIDDDGGDYGGDW
jgi:hypothetical protein